jgi:hypothetical protein
MRKLVLVGILFFIFSFISYGQRAQLGFFYLPQKTSISNSISDKDDPIFQNKTTFGGGAGINFTYWTSEYLGIQIGLMYTSHNQKFVSKFKDLSYADSMRTYKGKKRLDYIKVPILLVSSTPINKHMSIYGYAGPQFSYLLKGDGAVVIYKHYGNGISDYFDLPPSGSNFYNKFVLEAVVGGGFEFNLTSELSVSTSLRFDYSISDIENKDALAYGDVDRTLYTFGDSDRKKAHNSSLGIMLGFNYSLAGKHDLVRPGGRRRHR